MNLAAAASGRLADVVLPTVKTRLTLLLGAVCILPEGIVCPSDVDPRFGEAVLAHLALRVEGGVCRREKVVSVIVVVPLAAEMRIERRRRGR